MPPGPIHCALRTALGLVLLGAAARAVQDPPPADGAAPVEASAPAPARTLDRAELKALLGRHKDALKEGRAEALARVLEGFAGHDNKELLRPLRKALDYEATREDRRRAEQEAQAEGFEDDPDEVALRVSALEHRVRAAAAVGLRGQGAALAGPALLERFEDRALRRDAPASAAVLVDELAFHGYAAAVDEVVRELAQLRTREVARACVRYLGRVECDDLDAVLLLCQLLEPPSPANVEAGENPPEAYWKERWQVWEWLRKDVVEALRLRTGRTWRSAEGHADGDGAAATRWVRDHAQELGLR